MKSIAYIIGDAGVSARARAVKSSLTSACDSGAREQKFRAGIVKTIARAGGEWSRTEPLIEQQIGERGAPVFVYDLL